MTNSRLIIFVLGLLPMLCGAQERRISLQECLAGSHSSNPGVLNAGLDERAARARKQETFASWFPTVSATALGFHALDPLLTIGMGDVLGYSDAANNLKYYLETEARLAGINTEWSTLHHGYLGGVTLTQPLFAGGRIANGNALASLGVKAAVIKKEMALRDNDDAIVRKYWTAVTLSAKKEALRQGIALVRSLEKDVAGAVDAGLAKESDLMQVRLKAKELDAAMNKLRTGEKLAKMDLFNASGVHYTVLGLDSMTLSDGFETLKDPSEYYEDEASVAESLVESRLLAMNVESKKLEKRMTLGEGLPEVALGASMGYGHLVGDPQTNGMVFAVVKIPITDWGRTARKLQRGQYEIEKAENEKAFLEKQLLLKVSKDWMELQSSWDEKIAKEEALGISEMLESQKRDEYGAGLCTLSELLQSQTDLQSARSAFVDSQAAYCNALSVWLGEARK